MAKKSRKIPATSKAAEGKDYRKVKVKHAGKERKKWVLLKHGSKKQFEFVRAASASVAAAGSHTVCYYDPDTGFYDDCHTV